MNNELQIFNNAEFGNIRTIIRDNEIWFVGKDVAKALGYKDTDYAVRTHIDDEDKQLFNPEELSGLKISNYGAIIINESGLYSLILSSKLPTAKKFKHWITSEVLPSIRKTGSYSIKEPKEEIIPKTKGSEALLEAINMAEILQSKLQVQKCTAINTCLDIVSKSCTYDLSPIKKLFPVKNIFVKEAFTPTEIGKQLGIKAMYVNSILHSLGLQTKIDSDWRLTNKAYLYGTEIPYSRNGHSGYQIKWNKEVIPLVSSEIYKISIPS